MIEKNFYEACKDIFKNNVMYRQYITSNGNPYFTDVYIKRIVDWIAFYENHIRFKGAVSRIDIEETWVKVKLTQKQIRDW